MWISRQACTKVGRGVQASGTGLTPCSSASLNRADPEKDVVATHMQAVRQERSPGALAFLGDAVWEVGLHQLALCYVLCDGYVIRRCYL